MVIEFLDKLREQWPRATLSAPVDLVNLDRQSIPASRGIYVLLALDKTNFIYPRGNSSVFYIGRSGNLLGRLLTHQRYLRQAQGDRRYELYLPRYEYGARFGAQCCYVRTWQGTTPQALEEKALGLFVSLYASFPVANSQGAWNRI